ncbi:hypothetical protein C8A00DRAFT_16788 [Chaetomidium leptoderma]|uniref:DUF7357 domain-containing protein n=1 Tax=Chaetomidium leptoderma TaxID=669021 RepID=A0AAN6VHW6_9PEZI|nr:hypothetical protein C8A00DRAFT_16788 [Chaetomidium leptoderma]
MGDSNSLRLRLVVRRHALPEVRVVFAVQLDTDPTIAKLLEQVNEIIPLESNDWGLEDYAVELRDSSGHGFDCLHFQQVSVILKNDEEIFIRPLDTGDRRKRRLSGRVQISSGGKHLIDGVAFGRPRLRTPRDRPPVDIPPLKRRRITYEAEEDEDDEPRLLLTEHGEDERADRVRAHARFDHAEGGASEGDDEDADDDFVDEDTDEGEGDLGPDDDLGDSDLEDELRDLQAENEQPEDGAFMEPAVLDEIPQRSAPGEATALDLETLDKISALRTAFPTVQADACEKALASHGGNTESAYFQLQTQHWPLTSIDAVLKSTNPSEPRTTAADDDVPDDSEAESVASMVKHYDQHGFPSGSILTGTASAQIVDAMRKSGLPVKPPVHTKFDDDVEVHAEEAAPRSASEKGESPSDDERGSDDDRDSDDRRDSDDDSESDSGPEIASSKIPKASGGAGLSGIRGLFVSDNSNSESESESESGNESDSSSEAESSVSDGDDDSDDSSDSNDGNDLRDGASDSADGDSDHDSDIHGSDHSSSSSGESDESDSPSDDGSSNGSGDDALESRSAEKETIAAMPPSAPPGKSVLRPPSESTCRETECSCRETEFVSAETPKPVPPGQGKLATQKRNARRRAARMAQNAAARGALSSPAGGVEALPIAESQDLAQSIAAKKAALLQSLNMVKEALSQQVRDVASIAKGDESALSQAPPADKSVPDVSCGPTQEQAIVDSTETSPQRKSQLDVDAGRPVGFGPPGLINNPQQLVDHRVPDSDNSQRRQFEDESAMQEDPEAWRDMIVYRAVECCQDGVELSEPPFPFVQRWDPQQQYFAGDKNKRGGRSKRKQRNQEEFLDEGSRSSAKRRRYGEDSLGFDADDGHEEAYTNYDDTTGFEDTVLNYDDEPQETQEQPQQTPTQNADDEDDLPPLPIDVSTLPTLNPGAATAGMILTWKQWLLSKATNWQPQVLSLTGTVVDVLNDTITVCLAKRDWNLDRNEKVYDDDGNRVYDKFELPGMDDEGDEASEQGYRAMDLADMIEPRILQSGPEVVEPTPPEKQPSNSGQGDAGRDAAQHGGLEPFDNRVSATPDNAVVEKKGVGCQQMDIDTHCGDGQSIIPETPIDQEVVDTSISEDRRHEISLLINDAGFRKDVDPCVTDMTDNACLDLSSPSRQLEEMTHDATIGPFEVSEIQGHSSLVLPSQTTSNNVDSQPILLEPFHGFSDAISEPHDGRRVAYPRLELPTSETGSLHSGRQVDPDFSIELGDDSFQPDLDDPATVSRSTLGRHSDDERKPAIEKLEDDSDAGSKSDSTDSSFPSLSEVWISASTNGSKSPGKRAVMSAVKARKPDVAPDLEYEEAMRRLDSSDNISEDDNTEHLSTLAQKLVDKPIEKPTPKKPLARKNGALKSSAAPRVKLERASPVPARAVRGSSSRTLGASSSPFVVPEGSQVVSLVSSSPEPELEEHYAEDSVDETYKEPTGSMPTGAGWVKKSRARRGVSMPASPAARDATPKSGSSSQSKPITDKRSTAALGSLLRARKKVLSNMF